MYKIDMTTNDVDRQIALLKFYPEIVEKHFRSTLNQATTLLYANILPTIPRRTGFAQSKFRKTVTGKGIDMVGDVGWFGKGQPWYMNIVEYGAKPHKIEAKEGGFLGFGSTVVRSVNHPGFPARGFMQQGYETLQGEIGSMLTAAGEAVVNEMAVK